MIFDYFLSSLSVEWYIWFIKDISSLLLASSFRSVAFYDLIFRVRWDRGWSKSCHIWWNISIAHFIILEWLCLIKYLHTHSMWVKWITLLHLLLVLYWLIAHYLGFLTREEILDARIDFNIWCASFHDITSIIYRLIRIITTKWKLIFTLKDFLISLYSWLL